MASRLVSSDGLGTNHQWPAADELDKEVLEKKSLSKERGMAGTDGATTVSSPRSKARPRERDGW